MRVLMFFIALLCFVTAGILEITNIPGILALIVGLVALRFAFRGERSSSLKSSFPAAMKNSTNSTPTSLNGPSNTSIPLIGR